MAGDVNRITYTSKLCFILGETLLMEKKLTSHRLVLNACLAVFTAVIASQVLAYANILTIYCSGGWDPTMVFDPKIGVSEVTAETGATLRTATTGIQHVHHSDRTQVKTFFDTFGTYTAIINGVNIGAVTQQSMPRATLAITPNGKKRPADWLSVYAATTNPLAVAPHVVINAPYLPGDMSPYSVYLDSDAIESYLDTSQDYTSARETALLTLHRSSYARLLSSVTTDGIDGSKAKSLTLHALREQNLKAAITAADTAIGGTPDYTDFTTQGKFAVELMKKGTTQAVTLGCGNTDAWNTTSNHFNAQSTLYQNLFKGLNSILSYASTSGVLSNMIVLVVSDAGKTPTTDDQNGKGLWPTTSWLLFGATVNGAKTHGATDSYLRGSVIDPVFGVTNGQNMVNITPARIFSAIFDAAGIPYKTILPSDIPLSFLFRKVKT